KLRNGYRRLCQQLKQESLELVVTAVDLVDQQYRRTRSWVVERGQQRPLQQVIIAEKVGLTGRLAASLSELDREQLTRIVPLVQRLGRGQPLVALQPDQRGVEYLRKGLGRLGLANTGLTLEQDRLSHTGGQEERRPQRLIGEIADLVKRSQQTGHIRQ